MSKESTVPFACIAFALCPAFVSCGSLETAEVETTERALNAADYPKEIYLPDPPPNPAMAAPQCPRTNANYLAELDSDSFALRDQATRCLAWNLTEALVPQVEAAGLRSPEARMRATMIINTSRGIVRQCSAGNIAIAKPNSATFIDSLRPSVEVCLPRGGVTGVVLLNKLGDLRKRFETGLRAYTGNANATLESRGMPFCTEPANATFCNLQHPSPPAPLEINEVCEFACPCTIDGELGHATELTIFPVTNARWHDQLSWMQGTGVSNLLRASVCAATCTDAGLKFPADPWAIDVEWSSPVWCRADNSIRPTWQGTKEATRLTVGKPRTRSIRSINVVVDGEYCEGGICLRDGNVDLADMFMTRFGSLPLVEGIVVNTEGQRALRYWNIRNGDEFVVTAFFALPKITQGSILEAPLETKGVQADDRYVVTVPMPDPDGATLKLFLKAEKKLAIGPLGVAPNPVRTNGTVQLAWETTGPVTQCDVLLDGEATGIAPMQNENHWTADVIIPRALSASVVCTDGTEVVDAAEFVLTQECFESSDCEDGNACTTDGCDPSTGCTHQSVDCEDFDACTADSCDLVFGCDHQTIVCDDNNPYTSDSCNSFVGCEHTPIVCDDYSACTTDFYDPSYGCQYIPIVCEDYDACTADSCNSAYGCAHESINCDDGNPYTNDSCNSYSGCQHDAIICDDYNACTTDSYDPYAGCVYAPINCDDGDACNGVEYCDYYWGCFPAAPLACDDYDACTADSCSAASGCTHDTINCDDGNPYTADSCNSSTGCQNEVIVCDDANTCTTDQYDPLMGCIYTPITCVDASCPAECAQCGDGYCNGAEDGTTCWQDCSCADPNNPPPPTSYGPPSYFDHEQYNEATCDGEAAVTSALANGGGGNAGGAAASAACAKMCAGWGFPCYFMYDNVSDSGVSTRCRCFQPNTSANHGCTKLGWETALNYTWQSYQVP